jgi:hypothetical protein
MSKIAGARQDKKDSHPNFGHPKIIYFYTPQKHKILTINHLQLQSFYNTHKRAS